MPAAPPPAPAPPAVAAPPALPCGCETALLPAPPAGAGAATVLWELHPVAGVAGGAFARAPAALPAWTPAAAGLAAPALPTAGAAEGVLWAAAGPAAPLLRLDSSL